MDEAVLAAVAVASDLCFARSPRLLYAQAQVQAQAQAQAYLCTGR